MSSFWRGRLHLLDGSARTINTRLRQSKRELHCNSILQKPREPSTSQGSTRLSSRLDKLESRLPQFLKRYTQPLRNAPVSHITSFLILHEITALVPLFGLAGLFHYTDWIPLRPAEWEWGRQGIDRFERWARRRGWVADGPRVDTAGPTAIADGQNMDREQISEEGDLRVQQRQISPIVLQLAAAWAITKAVLPVRLWASVWATPWFAQRILSPCTRIGMAAAAALRK